MNEAFELKRFVIAMRHMATSHTSENLAKVLNNVFEEWNIGPKVFMTVTDGAANMVAMMTHLPSMERTYCFAHLLNLVVQKGLYPRIFNFEHCKIGSNISF